jgi:hypothetical protein
LILKANETMEEYEKALPQKASRQGDVIVFEQVVKS